jgi:hypothetical protein
VPTDGSYDLTVIVDDAQAQSVQATISIAVSTFDTYFNLTTLALPADTGANVWIRDSSTNDFNLTVNGDARPSKVSPYLANWSNFFDGNGDRIQIANTSALDFGTGDFTIECWVYSVASLTSYSLEYAHLLGKGNGNGGGTYALSFYQSKIYFAGIPLQGATTLSAGVWYHFAATRSGSTFRLFVNGVQDATTTNSTNFTSSESFNIGDRRNGDPSANYPFNGYISNVRVVKGTALYTSNFTPSTTPLTAVANTQLLTCQSNRFRDNSTNAFAVTVEGNTTVQTFAPFIETDQNIGSGYFDGTGDFISLTNSAPVNFGSSNFTVEFWVYPTKLGAAMVFFSTKADSTQTGDVDIRTDYIGATTTTFYVSGGGGSITTTFTGCFINQWTHIALARNGATVTLYFNGTVAASTSGGTQGTSNLAGIRIGGGSGLPAAGYESTTGYIADFRIINGSTAYTGAFTPPSISLTAVANTSFLSLQYPQGENNQRFVDQSTNRFVINRNGSNTTQGTFSPFSQTGWSNFFDGSGDFLSWNSGSSVAFGTGDFTVEAFVYVTSTPNTKYIIDARDSSNTGAWAFAFGLGGIGYKLGFFDGTTTIEEATASIPNNSWQHCVAVRSGTTLSVYLNGSRVATATNSKNLNVSPTTSYIGTRYTGSGYDLEGYISNVRIIKGTAAYDPTQTTITVPTAQLTDVTNTVLLTCASNRFFDKNTQATAKTITVAGGTPSVQAFSPFASAAEYNAAAVGGSGYFNGIDSNELWVSNNTGLNLASAAWTAECWVYLIGNYVDYHALFAKRVSNSGTTSYEGFINITTGALAYYNGTIYASSGIVPRFAWSHCAWSHNGTTLKMFLNGAEVFSQNIAVVEQNVPLYIGGLLGYAGENFNGYMADFRIVKGTAVYTSSFTPPTAPLTNIANTQLLLNFTNAGIVDVTAKNALEAVGGARVSRVQSKFGGSSLAFDGTGDYLALPNSVNLDQTGDFTQECWYYRSGAGDGNLDVIFIKNVTNYLYLAVDRNSLNKVVVNQHNVGSLITGTTQTVTNTWYHLAVTRSGSSVRLFVNGTQEGSTTTYSTNTSGSAASYAGGFPAAHGLNGYIDDLRITRFARYTANFTPPTATFKLR